MGVAGTYASDGNNNIGECMSYPYSAVEKLLNGYDVADVLIMVADVMNERAGTVNRAGYPGVGREWQRSAKIVSKAVSQLPKISGIK